MINAADHLGLVHSIAQRYRWACCAALEYEDLAQLGTMGLLRAIKGFDPERGVTFSTYAAWWIRAFIGRGIADQRRLVRVPVNAQAGVPSEATVAVVDELSEGMTRGTAVLSTPPSGTLGVSLDAEKAYAAISDERTRKVVRMRMAGHELHEIGDEIGICRERVRQLERAGIKQARRRLRDPQRGWA